MKSLLLLRHAKTIPIEAGGFDFDRTLTERGIADATRVGRYIHEHQIRFEFVISSTAKRARQTTELVMKAAEINVEALYDRRLYEAGPQQLLEVVTTIDSQWESALLVGHNPGLEDLLRLLTGGSESMSTSTLALIDVAADDWKLMPGICKLEWIITP